MKNRLLGLLMAMALLLPALAAAVPPEVSTVEWTTMGTLVRFHLQFVNNGTEPTETSSGVLSSQEFGAFMPLYGTIGSFDVPLSSLPPSAQKFSEWAKDANVVECGADDHWDGNVDLFFAGMHINVHNAHMYVCPGHGNSLIHLMTACNGWMPWVIGNVCAGFHVAVQNMDRSAAPNPVPPGWQGFIVGWADATVPLGTICCFQVTFTCNGVNQAVWCCLEACDCSAVPIEQSTWGTIKSLYR